MHNRLPRFTTLIAAALLALPALAQDPAAGASRLTILEVMKGVITPASDAIWQNPEPANDEEWLKVENGALAMIAASELIQHGGAGPMDAEWIKQPAWQAFHKIMLDASVQALTAARTKDKALLATAGEVLYPPCEGCHLQFNPAVLKEQQEAQ